MTTSRLKLVAEGQSDIHLIRKLISHELNGNMSFYASQGRASLVSVARNLIVHEGGPVLLVMNADSNNLHVKRELEAMTIVAMSGVASGGSFYAIPSLFKVFMFVPEIAVVFFEAPDALERVTGQAISKQVLEAGRMAPAVTLAKLTGDSNVLAVDMLTRKIDEQAIDMLRKGKQANEFRENVESLLREAMVA